MNRTAEERTSAELRDRVLNGRYELLAVIGAGGMATVYRARDLRLSRPVAIKVLHGGGETERENMMRFRRESEATAGLSAHPNIVSVYDVGVDGDRQYLVMELVDGQSLKDVILREAPLAPARAVGVTGEIAAALEFAHRHGIIHRDIKPQNVLITSDGSVKVADFGISRSLESTEMTEAGTVFGTAHYLSPEQARGQPADVRSDVYGLGIVLFEMLTGRLPFDGETPIGVAIQQIQQPAPTPSSYRPGLPPWLDAVVLRALAKDPQQRYATPADLREALRHEERRPPPAQTRRTTRRETRKLDPLGFILLGLLIASTAVALVVYAGFSSLLAGHSNNHRGPISSPPRHAGRVQARHPKIVHPRATSTPVPANQVASPGTIQLTYISYDQSDLAPNQPLHLLYTVDDTSSSSFPVGLGASLAASNGLLIHDRGHYRVVTALPGVHQYARTFVVPGSTPAGTYGIDVTVGSPRLRPSYGTIRLPGRITVSGGST